MQQNNTQHWTNWAHEDGIDWDTIPEEVEEQLRDEINKLELDLENY